MSARELPAFDGFAQCIGDRFRWQPGGEASSELVLIDARELPAGNRPGNARKPFSLIFRDPSGVVFPQRIYQLAHDGLGVMDLFLVPIGPDAEGMCFQAVFG